MVTKEKVVEIIRSVESKGGYYRGYAFGDSNPDALIDLVNAMPEEEDNKLNTSKVIREIKAHQTGKLPANANMGIRLIVEMIQDEENG